MNLPTRHALIGMALGAICATALATTGPGAVIDTFADEMLNTPIVAPGFDASKLVKFEDRRYRVHTEDWVSQDPTSSQVVKKVEGGRVSYVTIATTSTGTYSTDAMFSKNVQYPGIEVEEVPRYGNRFSYWNGRKWFGFSSRGGNSFFYIRNGNTRVSHWGNTTCVSGKGFTVC